MLISGGGSFVGGVDCGERGGALLGGDDGLDNGGGGLCLVIGGRWVCSRFSAEP